MFSRFHSEQKLERTYQEGMRNHNDILLLEERIRMLERYLGVERVTIYEYRKVKRKPENNQ